MAELHNIGVSVDADTHYIWFVAILLRNVATVLGALSGIWFLGGPPIREEPVSRLPDVKPPC